MAANTTGNFRQISGKRLESTGMRYPAHCVELIKGIMSWKRRSRTTASANGRSNTLRMRRQYLMGPRMRKAAMWAE